MLLLVLVHAMLHVLMMSQLHTVVMVHAMLMKHVVMMAALQTVVAVMVNSHVQMVVHMVIVFLNHGSAMVGMTVQVLMMKQIVHL